MAQQNLKGWIIFFSLAVIWGSSFILMKKGLLSYTPYQIASLRIVAAAGFLALIGFKKFKNLKKKDFWPLLWVGILGNAIPYILFPIAITRIDSSIIGVINSLVPIFTMILGVIVFGVRFSLLTGIGVGLGFMGAYFLINPTGQAGSLPYAGFAIVASLCYAINVNITQKRLHHLDAMTISVISLNMVALPYLIYLFFTDFPIRTLSDPQGFVSFGYIVLLGVLGTGIAIIYFNQLIKETSALFASSVTYFIPIMAIFWGWVDGEPIGLNHLGGIIGILSGVYLINYSKRLALKKNPASNGSGTS